MHHSTMRTRAAVLIFALAAASAPTHAATFTVLHTFLGPNAADGALPSGVGIDAAGDLFGVTQEGGSAGYGTVYELAAGGTYRVVHQFADDSGGYFPYGSLVRAPGGGYFGSATGGGTANVGTVYHLDAAGNESLVHSFAGGTDGAEPGGGLVADARGNLYGTTSVEGAANASCLALGGCGTVFRIAAGTGAETVLAHFATPLGFNPTESLVLDASGNVYGVDQNGGDTACHHPPLSTPYGCGTVFKVDASGRVSVLHWFEGQALHDGRTPFFLVGDATGHLYGVTLWGGAHDHGTLFEIDPAGNEQVLYSFTGKGDGSEPGGLLLAGDRLYGTASAGGNLQKCGGGCGTVFAYDLRARRLTVLHAFENHLDGAYPSGPMAIDAAGNVYGTTGEGGELAACGGAGCGTLYRLAP